MSEVQLSDPSNKKKRIKKSGIELRGASAGSIAWMGAQFDDRSGKYLATTRTVRS
jgi:hypothetical protein